MSLSWFEPRWSWYPRYVGDLKKSGLLSMKSWLRIYAICGVILALLLFAIYRANPAFTLPPAAYLTPFVVPPMILLKPALLCLCPVQVCITDNFIALCHGDRRTRIPRSHILSASIDTSDPARARLNLRYNTRRGQERSLSIGIPERVSPEAIDEAIGRVAVRPL